MKIAFTSDLKLGLNSFTAGDEIDMPDERFAQALIAAGHATAADDKPKKKAKKTAEPVEEEKPKSKNYKTRQIKAEDD